MNFKSINKDLLNSLELLEKINNTFDNLDIYKYSDKHEELNKKLNLLYNNLYNKINIPYDKIVHSNENDKNLFLNKRIYFTKKLNKIKYSLMMLKEKLYPWPWINIVTQNIVPESKICMELMEIRYSQLLSTTFFYLSSTFT